MAIEDNRVISVGVGGGGSGDGDLLAVNNLSDVNNISIARQNLDVPQMGIVPVKQVSSTTYTLLEADKGYEIYFTNVLGCDVTCPDGFDDGFECTLINDNIGIVNISASLLRGSDIISLQYGSLKLTHRGLNIWYSIVLENEAAANQGIQNELNPIDFSPSSVPTQLLSMTLTADRIKTAPAGLSESNPTGLLEVVHAGFLLTFTTTSTFIFLNDFVDVGGRYFLKFQWWPSGIITVQSIKDFGTGINTKEESGTTYTLVESDNGKEIFLTNVAGCAVTCPDGLSDGFQCLLINDETGTLSLSAATTLRGVTSVADQYGSIKVTHRGSNIFYSF